jgi:hypothetical protein
MDYYLNWKVLLSQILNKGDIQNVLMRKFDIFEVALRKTADEEHHLRSKGPKPARKLRYVLCGWLRITTMPIECIKLCKVI